MANRIVKAPIFFMHSFIKTTHNFFGWALVVAGFLLFLLLLEVFFVIYFNDPTLGPILGTVSLLEITITTFSSGGLSFPLMICFVEIIMCFQLFLGCYLLRKATDDGI